MYKVTNVAASRDEGCWHHNPDGFSPGSHTLGFEPWIAGMQLKLYEDRTITDKEYEVCKDHLAELVIHRVVKVERISEDTQIDEVKPVEPESEEKVFDLSDVAETRVEEVKEVVEEVKPEPEVKEQMKQEPKTIQLPKKKGNR